MDTELNRFLRHAVPFQRVGDTYEGRTLPHPEEEVEDQGPRFDAVSVRSRRGLLGALRARSSGEPPTP